MSFKENWNKCDEKCLSCGNIVKRQRGITKQNLKRLITPRLDVNELLITFILILVICLGLLYQSETKTCREWVKKLQDNPVEVCGDILNPQKSNESIYLFNRTQLDNIIIRNQSDG